MERKDRRWYIRNTINYKRLSHQENDLKFLCIQISKPKIKPFLVGTWYRPPGTTIETIEKFESTLRELESFNLEVNIIGDINCDVGASPLDHKTQKLLDMCNICQYSQMIKHPTRMTKDTRLGRV